MSIRWRIFAVFSLLYLLAYFYRVALAVLAEDISREMNLSPAQLGTLAGAFFYAFAFAQLPLGLLLDRFGGKRTVILTGIITVTGVILFASSHQYALALTGRILIGAGSASVLMGALRVFTNWYDSREFGRISGLIIAVGNIGNLAATAPLAIASTYAGWRNIFLAIAVVQFLSLALAHYLVDEHPAGRGIAVPQSKAEQLQGLRAIISTPSYWLISFSAFSWYACYMAVQGLWGGPYLMEVINLSKPEAGSVLLATSLGFLVGCIFIGDLTERVLGSPKRTMALGQGLLLIFMSLFLGPMEQISRPLLGPVFFLMGLAVSSGVAVYPLIRESFPHRIIGTALTSVNFFVLLGAATVQQIMGTVISRFPASSRGSYPSVAYNQAFLLPFALLAVSSLLFLWTRDPRRSGTSLFSGQ